MAVNRALIPAVFDLRMIIGRRKHRVNIKGRYPLQRHDDGLRTDKARVVMVVFALKGPR